VGGPVLIRADRRPRAVDTTTATAAETGADIRIPAPLSVHATGTERRTEGATWSGSAAGVHPEGAGGTLTGPISSALEFFRGFPFPRSEFRNPPPKLRRLFPCSSGAVWRELRRQLGSASTPELNVLPMSRAFPVAAARVLNGLPPGIIAWSSLRISERQLKTSLFGRSFDEYSVVVVVVYYFARGSVCKVL